MYTEKLRSTCRWDRAFAAAIEDVTVHPEYDAKTKTHADIAILTTDRVLAPGASGEYVRLDCDGAHVKPGMSASKYLNIIEEQRNLIYPCNFVTKLLSRRSKSSRD